MTPIPILRRPMTGIRGFTLVEVVVGMVLMASLVASSMLAIAAQKRAIRLAADRTEACLIADQMLGRWNQRVQSVPRRSRGPIAGHRNWYWRTQPVGRRLISGVPVQIVRFQIIKARTTGAGVPTGQATLVSIDLVAGGRSLGTSR